MQLDVESGEDFNVMLHRLALELSNLQPMSQKFVLVVRGIKPATKCLTECLDRVSPRCV